MTTSKTACAAIAAVLCASAGAATIDIATQYAGQAFSGEYTGLTAGNTYTLSADFAFTNAAGKVQLVRAPKEGETVFDFSSGNHVLKTGGVRINNGDKKPCKVTFIGGVWDVGGGMLINGGNGWNNIANPNVTYVFDGVVITNYSTAAILLTGYGTNQNYIVKGGSRFYGPSNYVDMRPATSVDYGAGKELSSLLEFSGGSKFYSKSTVFDNRDSSTPRMQNFTIRFKGEGTVATGTEAGGAGTCDFYFGHKSPGNHLEVVDGARFNFRFFNVGGYYDTQAQKPSAGCENGYSNSVYVANGGEISTTYTLTVGQVPGADHNSVLVDDGGRYLNPLTSHITIGSRSSFNSFTITNGTVTARGFKLGACFGANSNLLHIAGARTSLTLNDSLHTFFSEGVGNTVLFDDGASFGGSNVDLYFSDANGLVPSTGNTVRVEGGANVTGRYVRMITSRASTSNTFVVADATLSVGEFAMASQSSSGNTLCISNGTLNYTRDYGLHCSGTGNVFRLSGAAPKIRYTGDAGGNGTATIRYGATVLFDMSAVDAAYAEPVIVAQKFEMQADTNLAFEGLEELSERLPARTDFVLVRTTASLGSYLNSAVIERANAALPSSRYRLFLANDDKELVLRVPPPSLGFIINIR